MGAPAGRRETRARGHLYLERTSLIDMTEKPVIVMSRPLPGEQTQIVRRPVRKASGRRWIFIFGGAAAMATLVAVWVGFAHQASVRHTTPVVAAMPVAPVAPPREFAVASRPIVAPIAERQPVVAAAAPVELDSATRAPAPASRSVRKASTGPASGRHSKAALARTGSSSRLASHHQRVHLVRPAATMAWVDPFIDR